MFLWNSMGSGKILLTFSLSSLVGGLNDDHARASHTPLLLRDWSRPQHRENCWPKLKTPAQVYAWPCGFPRRLDHITLWQSVWKGMATLFSSMCPMAHAMKPTLCRAIIIVLFSSEALISSTMCLFSVKSWKEGMYQYYDALVFCIHSTYLDRFIIRYFSW